MASDISRTDDSGRQHYKGVVMQQGRVILDRDFNALQEITEERTDADALDFVGPCGTPDNGFAIDAIIPGSPPLWVPPPPLSPPALHNRDFLISPGTMYVGGQRAVFPPADYGQPPITYSYFDQPEWIQPDEPNTDATLEFVYLHLLEQEVSAVEDTDLKDVALGGPDTTQRVRLIKRVKRLKVDSGDCTAAFAQAQVWWRNNNLAFDPKTMRLLPQASLKVSFSTQASQPDPCEPVAQGGYLQPENQLIRVQIVDGGAGGTPKLLWGYDNASFLYRADISDSKTLLLRQSPVDAFHIPRAGQVVEVLRSALIIDSEQDETDPLKPRSLVRCVAEANGVIRTLSTGYQPSDRSIKLDQPLPPDYVNDSNPLFVRIWQSELDLSASESSTVELIDTSNNSTTGIVVTINMSLARGQLQAPVGAYWLFAARPGTPQAVYPERFLTDAQPPDGPRQWVCPLAVIDWMGQTTSPPGSPPTNSISTVHDCREKFDNLVELTKRKLGECCAITVRPEDLQADPMALQKALDKFANGAQGVAICLAPGRYSLAQPLRLDSRHLGITIESAHGGVTIQAAGDADLSKFLDGLVVLTHSTGVTLRSISFLPPAVPLSKTLQTSKSDTAYLQQAISRLFDPNMIIGLRLFDCTDVTVIDCEFKIVPSSGVGNFAAALFANGVCTGLSVRQSRFVGPARVPPTISSVVVRAEASRQESAQSLGATPPSGAAKLMTKDTGIRGTSELISPNISASTLAGQLNPNILGGRIGTIPFVSFPIPTVPIMLSAFLVAPSIHIGKDAGSTGLLAWAVLDQMEFIGNRMQGLTAAGVALAGTGDVRFQDNLIADCIGGIWFGSVFGDAAGAVQEVWTFQNELANFESGQHVVSALDIAANYPLPDLPFSPTVNLPTLPTPQFHLTGNRIDALPADGTTSGPAVYVNIRTPIGSSSATSLLLNSNELRNRSGSANGNGSASTAFLFSEHYTIAQGNLIQNLSSGSQIYSLYMGNVGGPAAVTGNIFIGKASLTQRNDIQPFPQDGPFSQLNSWKFLNYDLSDRTQ